ncbi:hypothetical protein L6164_028476 [Bauhinia variegata]|uniref:Uncharacterized protein n=1 Tax=Bauhinia variegata TaxID=167791 RepID=A0ACB9L624_BAUVA|nr:hypothetical protein L6164_028476 [Bauhinia variegata]
MSRRATKKKSSRSGGAKNEIGVLCKEQFGSTLGFFGAGGHVEISGIRNLSAFGVVQPLAETSIISESMSPMFEESLGNFDEQLPDIPLDDISWFLLCGFCFLKWVILGDIFGIRNLSAFGVVVQLPAETSITSESMSPISEDSVGNFVEQLLGIPFDDFSWFLLCGFCFLKWVLLGFLLLGFVLVLPEGAIRDKNVQKASARLSYKNW